MPRGSNSTRLDLRWGWLVDYTGSRGQYRFSHFDEAKRARDGWSRALDSGADAQTRTEDLLITNQLLYQLSYISEGLGLYARAFAPANINAPTQRFLNAGLRFSTKAAMPSF